MFSNDDDDDDDYRGIILDLREVYSIHTFDCIAFTLYTLNCTVYTFSDFSENKLEIGCCSQLTTGQMARCRPELELGHRVTGSSL